MAARVSSLLGSERKFQSTPAPKEISEISRGNEEERREISVRLDPEEAPAASRWLLEGPACSFGREERPGQPRPLRTGF